jgi:hypothetical protein
MIVFFLNAEFTAWHVVSLSNHSTVARTTSDTRMSFYLRVEQKSLAHSEPRRDCHCWALVRSRDNFRRDRTRLAARFPFVLLLASSSVAMEAARERFDDASTLPDWMTKQKIRALDYDNATAMSGKPDDFGTTLLCDRYSMDRRVDGPGRSSGASNCSCLFLLASNSQVRVLLP